MRDMEFLLANLRGQECDAQCRSDAAPPRRFRCPRRLAVEPRRQLAHPKDARGAPTMPDPVSVPVRDPEHRPPALPSFETTFGPAVLGDFARSSTLEWLETDRTGGEAAAAPPRPPPPRHPRPFFAPPPPPGGRQGLLSPLHRIPAVPPAPPPPPRRHPPS